MGNLAFRYLIYIFYNILWGGDFRLGVGSRLILRANCLGPMEIKWPIWGLAGLYVMRILPNI